ncbi:MAG: GAF domain-containing protein [Opitutaceae bacterium]|nr:GAF domain-containing protein [Opitutaceae bacterium]
MAQHEKKPRTPESPDPKSSDHPVSGIRSPVSPNPPSAIRNPQSTDHPVSGFADPKSGGSEIRNPQSPPVSGIRFPVSPNPQSSAPRALPVLYRLAAQAARELDPRDALREALDLFIDAFRAEAGSIALLNPDTGNLQVEVQTGLPDGQSYHELKLGHGITGWCGLNRRALLVPDVKAESRYIAVRPTACCEMAAPILNEDQVIGVIDLECDRVGGFTPADLALLELFAAETARVMQRLWQLRHLQGKARQLESLITAGQSLVTKLEQQELFDTLTREARFMMQARSCALYVYDAETSTVRFASLTSSAVTPLPDAPIPLDSCAVASPIHTRRQVVFADIQSAEFRELHDLPADQRLVSMLATPLIFETEVLGVLAIFTERVHRFDNDEKRLCAALASLGAVALQNARLYARVFQSEDVLRKNERLTTLGLLAAEIAHEIRNPLTVLKLLHGGLGLEFPEGDPRKTDIRVIGEKLDQLEAIVSRVLNFAQAPSSLHARCSLTDVIEDTLLLVRLKLTQGKVALHFEPVARTLFVDAHKGQLQQVLLNLLLNATQAMPDGGTIEVTVSTEPRNGGRVANIDITDTGSGVPEGIRDRVFDSFLSGRPDGTGLGLAIAKRILLSHHGDITLLRTGGTGTTMQVTLPVA